MARRRAPSAQDPGTSPAAGGELAAQGKRQRLLTAERRAQILGLATRLFAERPYEDVSVDDLAQALGISKGLLYHYYPTKRDLYVAGLQQIANGLLTSTIGQGQDLPPTDNRGAEAPLAIERLLRALEGYLSFVTERAAAYLSLMRGGIGADPQVAAVLDGCREAYLAQLLTNLPGALPATSGLAAPPAPTTASATLRLLLRGYIGFVESASIEWLARGGAAGPVSLTHLRDTLANVLMAVLQTAIPAAL